MNTSNYESVIDDLVSLCGPTATKADLARFLDESIPEATIRVQDINNWRKRGIPVSKCDAVERAFEYRYGKHQMRPEAFSLPPSAA